MKPLTSLKYFWQNKRRAATIFVVLLLAVAVVSFITSLVTSIFIDSSKANLDALTTVSYISPPSNDIVLRDDIVNKVKDFSDIEKIYNTSISYTLLTTIVGNTSSPVFIPSNSNDIKQLMSDMDLTLSKE